MEYKELLYHDPSKTFTTLGRVDLLTSCSIRYYLILSRKRDIDLQETVHCTNNMHMTK